MTARNSRREVIHLLREIATWQRYMIRTWDVPGTVWLPTADRSTNDWRRPRRPDEYPENQPEAWNELAQYMNATASQASTIARLATEQARALRADATPEE